MSITNDDQKFWELNTEDNKSIYFKTPSRVEYGTWYDGDDAYKVGIGITNPTDALLVVGDELETDNNLPLLHLNTERSWYMGAGDTNGAGTALIMYPEFNNKDFRITSTDWAVNYFRVRSNTTASSGYVCIAEDGSNVGIGTNNPQEKLHIEGATPTILLTNTEENESPKIVFADSSAVSTQKYELAFNASNQDFRIGSDDSPNQLYFDYAGNIGLGMNNPAYQLELSTDSAAKPTSSTWAISSDRRLKENIEDANLDICYNDVKELPLRRFKWIDSYIQKHNVLDTTNLGFIAQEVEKINKKAVITKIKNQYGLEDYKSINKDQLIMSLFGATKKLMNIVEELKENNNNNNNYDHDIEELNERIDEIEIKPLKIETITDTLNFTHDEEVFSFSKILKGKNTRSKCGKIPVYIESLNATKYMTIWD